MRATQSASLRATRTILRRARAGGFGGVAEQTRHVAPCHPSSRRPSRHAVRVRTRANITNAAAMLCSDGVHPNQAGCNAIAAVWAGASDPSRHRHELRCQLSQPQLSPPQEHGCELRRRSRAGPLQTNCVDDGRRASWLAGFPQCRLRASHRSRPCAHEFRRVAVHTTQGENPMISTRHVSFDSSRTAPRAAASARNASSPSRSAPASLPLAKRETWRASSGKL